MLPAPRLQRRNPVILPQSHNPWRLHAEETLRAAALSVEVWWASVHAEQHIHGY